MAIAEALVELGADGLGEAGDLAVAGAVTGGGVICGGVHDFGSLVKLYLSTGRF